MKKVIIALVLGVPLTVIAFGLHSMTQGDIEDVIICSTNDSAHYIPSSVCEHYLLNYRVTEKDITFLEGGAGLAFLFDIQDNVQKHQLVEHFVAKGVSLDKPSPIDGLPPLHAAILYNDQELVEMLVEAGADLDTRDRNYHLTPREFTQFLSQKNETTDREAILRILTLTGP